MNLTSPVGAIDVLHPDLEIHKLMPRRFAAFSLLVRDVLRDQTGDEVGVCDVDGCKAEVSHWDSIAVHEDL